MLIAAGALFLAFAAIMVASAPRAYAAVQQNTHYYFIFYHPSDGTYSNLFGETGWGDVSAVNEITINVNGTDWDAAPMTTPMILHLSCSDTWSDTANAQVGGFSDGSGGPTYATHPDWEVVSYYIFKERESGSPEPCGDANTTTTTGAVTTTTGAVTTTTAGEVTTTTAGEVTTTTAEVTTTTAGEFTTTTSGEVTTTVGGPGTTTTAGDITTTTGGATTTTVAGPCDPQDPECLPNNGAGDLLAFLLGGLGLLFMGSGSLVVASERRRLVA